MTAVHQVLVSVAYGDAVTNEALELRKLLRAGGPSEIFALFRDLRVEDVHDLSEYEQLVKGPAVLLVHYSIGHPEVQRFLYDRGAPIILRYHNITPAHYFEAFDPEMAERLHEGRTALAELAPRTRLAIAVSDFNAADLREAGFASIETVPFLMDPRRLLDVGPGELPAGVPASGGPLVLFTSRISPHKRHDLLIEAFHVLKTYLHPDARLVLVGSFYSPYYRYTLTRLVQELAVPDVVFTDQVPDATLADLYRRAAAFVCLSEHEGFGAPLIEAMAFKVPVVAWATSAVPETVGEAALLLEDPRPSLVAEAIHDVVADGPLREELIRRGLRRSADLRPDVVGASLVDLVRGAVA